MKAKKIIFRTGAIICETISVIFRIVELPAMLVSASLEAMGDKAHDTAMKTINAANKCVTETPAHKNLPRCGF